MSHNQNNDIMKPTDYIEWDNLKNIPFFLCQVVEDKENKDIDIYYLGKRVFHDYDHVGHYMRSAIILFRRIKNRTADWVNLQNLWTLRGCYGILLLIMLPYLFAFKFSTKIAIFQ